MSDAGINDWVQLGALGLLAGAMWWTARNVVAPFMERHLKGMDAQTTALQSMDKSQEKSTVAVVELMKMMRRFQPMDKDPSAYETVETNKKIEDVKEAMLATAEMIHRIASRLDCGDEEIIDRLRDMLDAKRREKRT